MAGEVLRACRSVGGQDVRVGTGEPLTCSARVEQSSAVRLRPPAQSLLSGGWKMPRGLLLTYDVSCCGHRRAARPARGAAAGTSPNFNTTNTFQHLNFSTRMKDERLIAGLWVVAASWCAAWPGGSLLLTVCGLMPALPSAARSRLPLAGGRKWTN